MTQQTHQYSISVMLPTRGRTDALQRSLTSLVDLAADVKSFQILLAFDQDDSVGRDYFVEQMIPYLDNKGVAYTALEFPRLGYGKLNVYYNEMIKETDSDWLFCWNDDAVMQTKHWDAEIRRWNGQFRLLRVSTHLQHPYSIFPIWPRAWYDVFGHGSRHQMIDAELSQIAYALDIMQNVDITVLHDRHDITGNNADDTHQSRILYENNPDDPRDFHHRAVAEQRTLDMLNLAEYLKSQGHDMTWWDGVINGTQDPWVKLRAADVNHLTRPLDEHGRPEHIQYEQSLRRPMPKELLCCLPQTIPDPGRIGCLSDGGYIIPRLLLEHCDHLLSGGLGENWSFDRHWKELKPFSRIHVYDGTVTVNSLKDYLREPYQRFFGNHARHFVENLGPNNTTLKTAIERLGSQRLLLKMDIEGGEFALIDEIVELKHTFPGIVIEIHFANHNRPQFIAAVNRLRQHYALVHLHGNNHTLLGTDGVCDCFEFTFVRKDLYSPSGDRHDFYLPGLDCSNVPGLEDWQFYFERS